MLTTDGSGVILAKTIGMTCQILFSAEWKLVMQFMLSGTSPYSNCCWSEGFI